MSQELRKVGLEINYSKCRLLTGGSVTTFPKLKQVAVSTSDAGLIILGSPVGSAEFSRAKAVDLCASASNFCKKLAQLKNPQVGVALLRYCCGVCKVLHLMRTVPSSLLQHELETLDNLMVETLQEVVGMSLTANAKEQVFLGLKFGGLGIRKALTLAPIAYATSMAAFLTRGVPYLALPDSLVPQRDEWLRICADLNDVVPPSAAQAYNWMRDLSHPFTDHPEFTSLNWWSVQVQIHQYA